MGEREVEILTIYRERLVPIILCVEVPIYLAIITYHLSFQSAAVIENKRSSDKSWLLLLLTMTGGVAEVFHARDLVAQ